MLENALQYSHTLLKEVVHADDIVIDATMGNGHDTKFLAELVGLNGTVYSFDIQKLALMNTTELLNQNNLTDRVKLIQDSHANIDHYVTETITGAIFNLGYLPGGDKTEITHASSTLTAIESCLELLKSNGRVILVCYYGHPGGKDELAQVQQFTSNLDQHQYQVLEYQFTNQIHHPPILIAIEKR
ncbi:tRNA (mnm(5)s(2)U34)-methyltransferase [Pediococcus argentinicus]|uniref:rRNA methylase n=1 Tax=Pediococcus argentinicus TaxID=480391 RepID=A0A0R2N9Y4_9LACO|nr:class I SAM-dependent methyltransferase [Pediococcus argentinicus]KRO21570.1 rRNA methylase [Pediococcus argentinicus]NKZ23118.1 methyltransferase domain-containing protein [Pediococcus argentinicus]GEP20307.1 rRNA methyltransferase [Pediococcus argentinicus]